MILSDPTEKTVSDSAAGNCKGFIKDRSAVKRNLKAISDIKLKTLE